MNYNLQATHNSLKIYTKFIKKKRLEKTLCVHLGIKKYKQIKKIELTKLKKKNFGLKAPLMCLRLQANRIYQR